jgi:hypothetical protein
MPRWTVPADRAHGVAISGDFAFGTSLGERRVYKIALATGQVVKTAGKLGWGAEDYLWPTALQATPDGRILIADAHLGRIREIDPESLKARRYLGTNGPGLGYFNMPYGLLANDDELGILSTFQNRILFLDGRFTKVRSQFLAGGDWGAARGAIAKQDRSLGPGWNGYTRVDGPPVSVWGRPYRAAFGYLHLPDPSAPAPTFSTPTGSSSSSFSRFPWPAVASFFRRRRHGRCICEKTAVARISCQSNWSSTPGRSMARSGDLRAASIAMRSLRSEKNE